MNEDENPLVVEDLVPRFHATDDTIRNWTKEEKYGVYALPCYRVGRRILFRRKDVEKWEREGGIARMGVVDGQMKASA